LLSTVLVVPHHGSKTSSSPAFLAAVSPRLALVQTGYRNRYGHPAPEVANRYAARGIPWLTTVECGAWSAASNEAPAGCERQRSRRYWHHGAEVAPSAGAANNTRETEPWLSTSR
jgi:competence protein ComEC